MMHNYSVACFFFPVGDLSAATHKACSFTILFGGFLISMS